MSDTVGSTSTSDAMGKEWKSAGNKEKWICHQKNKVSVLSQKCSDDFLMS